MSRAIGFDPGTAFLQVAEKNNNGEIEFKAIRNSFIELPETDDIEQVLKQNKWQYVKDKKNHYYVIGDDSLKIARLFPEVEIRRPMQNGVLNKGEDKKMLILANMIEKAIVKAAEDDTSVVCYCVSSSVIDITTGDNIFHKNRIEGMIKRLGYIPKCIDEAMGIVLSERPVVNLEDGQEIPYSGIAISFGAGRTNVVLAYRGLQILGMSCNRGGDYIDRKVSEQTDFPISKIISVKENKLDFSQINYDDDIEFALEVYYQNLIEYVFKNFSKKFSEVRSEFDAPLPIVIAGGTASPPGFRDKVESVVRGLDLPFEIKDIKISSDTCNAVVKGCLTQAIISQKKLKTKEIDEALE